MAGACGMIALNVDRSVLIFAPVAGHGIRSVANRSVT